MGTILIDTYKETFSVGLDRSSIKMVYAELRRILDSLRSPVSTPEADPLPGSAGDPYEAVKKLKELLDLGALSQTEFDQKKKELLDL